MIYDFTLKTGKGEDLNLADYKGKVILIVNTATGCGFTPQYAPIEQLYKDYHDQGLEILDIPCNQFGGQAPEQMMRSMNSAQFILTRPSSDEEGRCERRERTPRIPGSSHRKALKDSANISSPGF